MRFLFTDYKLASAVKYKSDGWNFQTEKKGKCELANRK